MQQDARYFIPKDNGWRLIAATLYSESVRMELRLSFGKRPVFSGHCFGWHGYGTERCVRFSWRAAERSAWSGVRDAGVLRFDFCERRPGKILRDFICGNRLPAPGLSVAMEALQSCLRNIFISEARGFCAGCFFTGSPACSQPMMPC